MVNADQLLLIRLLMFMSTQRHHSAMGGGPLLCNACSTYKLLSAVSSVDRCKGHKAQGGWRESARSTPGSEKAAVRVLAPPIAIAHSHSSPPTLPPSVRHAPINPIPSAVHMHNHPGLKRERVKWRAKKGGFQPDSTPPKSTCSRLQTADWGPPTLLPLVCRSSHLFRERRGGGGVNGHCIRVRTWWCFRGEQNTQRDDAECAKGKREEGWSGVGAEGRSRAQRERRVGRV